MKTADMQKTNEEIDAELEALATGKKPETAADATPPAGTAPSKDTDISPTPAAGDVTPSAAEVSGLATHAAATPVVEPSPTDGIDYKAEYERLISENSETWKEKYAAINGKYLAEVPRANHNIQGLQTEVTRLQGIESQLAEKDGQIADLQVKLTEAEKKAAAPAPAVTGVTNAATMAKIREVHGDEFGDLMEAMLKPVNATITDLQTKLAEAERKAVKAPSPDPDPAPAATGTAPSVEDEAKYWQHLTMQVPTFAEINNSPEFLKFLATTEKTSGLTYNDLLHRHHGKMVVGGDGKTYGVADVFKTYLGTTKAAPGADPGKPGFKGVDDQVDPSTVGGGKDITATKEIIIPRATYEKFYDDWQKRPEKMGLTQAELVARDAEYQQAELEGRVR